ncbi:MAG: methyl-accepting chemotaxis protein [Kineosporiaceae bacterium]
MMSTLRLLSIRGRLLVLAAVALSTVGALGFLAVHELGTARSRAASLTRVSDLQGTALGSKFDLADLNGWQNAYAFDVRARGPVGAADGSANRATFLQVAARTDRNLARLREVLATGTPARWRDLQATTQARYDEFMALDAEIAALYRTGDAADARKADDLVNNDEVAVYNAGARAIDDLGAELATVQATTAGQNDSSAAWSQRIAVTLAVGAFALVLAGVLTVTRSITQPLQRLRDRLDLMTGGDLTVRLATDGRDELATIATRFNTFADSIAGTVREVADASMTLAAASEELSSNTTTIASAAGQASSQAETVADASRQVNASVQGFATAANELGESIREIAQNTTQAAQIAASAVDLANATTATVQRLGQSSAEISTVVEMIQGVAAQTNLLALNATIEAARAGDAGKGFAVVAGEVKELAQETARATDDISTRIAQIQAETLDAVTAIDQIGQVIAQINDYQSSIAGAVEEQTSTAAEMSRSVAEAAHGSDEIAVNIDHVAQAAQTTSSSVVEAQTASTELARMGTHLQDLISGYRT